MPGRKKETEHLGGLSFGHTGYQPRILEETAFNRATLLWHSEGQSMAVVGSLE